MLKLILCAGVLALCVCCSYLLTRKYKQRFDFFYNLNLFNERLVNEVSYTKIPLPAFLEKYEFSGDFKKMLEVKKGSDFETECYDYPYLKEDEQKFLHDYFFMIGKSDAASQKTYLSAVRQEIGERRRASEDAYKRYFSLYLKLGFLAGLILVILIV